MGYLRLHLTDQVFLGLVGCKAGNALQHLCLAALDQLDFFQFLVGGGMLGSKRLLFLFNAFGLAIEGFFFLLQTALLLLDVGAAFLHFLLVLAAVFQNLFFCFKKCFPFFTFRVLDGFVDNARCFFFRAGDFSFRYIFTVANAEEEKDRRRNDKCTGCYNPA